MNSEIEQQSLGESSYRAPEIPDQQTFVLEALEVKLCDKFLENIKESFPPFPITNDSGVEFNFPTDPEKIRYKPAGEPYLKPIKGGFIYITKHGILGQADVEATMSVKKEYPYLKNPHSQILSWAVEESMSYSDILVSREVYKKLLHTPVEDQEIRMSKEEKTVEELYGYEPKQKEKL